MNNFFEIGNNKAFLGDCLDFMKSMEEKSVDIIVTSPPYNLNIKYGIFKDNAPRIQYIAWIGDVFREMKRILKDTGSAFINIGSSSQDPWVCYEVAFEARKFFELQNDITWVKSISINDKSFGHYKPINSKRFLNHTHEKIFHFSKFGNLEVKRTAIGVPYAHKSNCSRWGEREDLRCRGNSWFIPYETIHGKGRHPAIFPVSLAENCIKLHGHDDSTIVFDPFLGSGSTLVACSNMGTHGIGCEIDEDYFDISKKRLESSQLGEKQDEEVEDLNQFQQLPS